MPDRPQRRETLLRELRQALFEVRRVPDGYALRVADAQGAVLRLVELLSLHSQSRRLGIAVGPTAASGGQWVLCTGSRDVRHLLRRELVRPRFALPAGGTAVDL